MKENISKLFIEENLISESCLKADYTFDGVYFESREIMVSPEPMDTNVSNLRDRSPINRNRIEIKNILSKYQCGFKKTKTHNIGS